MEEEGGGGERGGEGRGRRGGRGERERGGGSWRRCLLIVRVRE